MPYPELMVGPMREELVNIGVAELRTADDVEAALDALADVYAKLR